MKRILLAFTLISVACITNAQDAQDKKIQIEAMQKIAFMEGNWSGTGWMMFGPDQKSHFNQVEEISLETGGTTLLIKGQGRTAHDGSLVHNALALVYYDSSKDEYVFDSHLAKGYHGSYKGVYENGKFIWFLNTPMGSMKYSISINEKGQWYEVGERQLAEGQWVQFFEMTLNKN